MPSFLRTPHLPHNSNATPDDFFASHQEVVPLFQLPSFVEEKVDGSFLMTMLGEDGHFVIRNKNHTLNKAFLGKTAAKNQYRSVHNYVHEHRYRWEKLFDITNRLCVKLLLTMFI